MVRREVDRLRAERSERLGIDADEVVRRFDDLYYEALVVGDLPTAARCTEALAKCVGAFGKHQRQKRPVTPEEVERIKAELEMRGFNFERTNAPPHLREGGRSPRPLAPVVVDDTTVRTSEVQ